MSVAGPYRGLAWGLDPVTASLAGIGAPTGYAMAGLNAGWAARFTATDSKDVKAVKVNWSSVSAPGAVTLRIETVDATTRKPTGTLYDAAAVKAGITPAAGWQTIAFDSPPTAGLTAGAEYAAVILTTTAGTTQTLRSYWLSASYPNVVLTAADGTTRSNFAEVNASNPVITFVMEDDQEYRMRCFPWSAKNLTACYANRAAGSKFVVPAGTVLDIAGVLCEGIIRVGTPTGNLRARVLNASDALVTGADGTADRASLANVGGSGSRRVVVPFSSIVTLAAGTYRAVVNQDDSGSTSSNYWGLYSLSASGAALVPSGANLTTTTDITAGTISWTDTATEVSLMGPLIDDVRSSGGGSIALPRIGAGLVF